MEKVKDLSTACRGDYFVNKDEDGDIDYYILCHIQSNKYSHMVCLVSLDTGNRYRDLFEVKDYRDLNREEIRWIFGNMYETARKCANPFSILPS